MLMLILSCLHTRHYIKSIGKTIERDPVIQFDQFLSLLLDGVQRNFSLV